MFAPSFFTGELIKRYGVMSIVLTGVALTLSCVGFALSGLLFTLQGWALMTKLAVPFLLCAAVAMTPLAVLRRRLR